MAILKGGAMNKLINTPETARKGRASYLGERSANHQDPGATSTTMLFESLRDALGTSG
jgi:dihydroxyacetone kinase-like protein